MMVRWQRRACVVVVRHHWRSRPTSSSVASVASDRPESPVQRWAGLASELSKARLSGFVATTAFAGYAATGAPLVYTSNLEVSSDAVLATLGVFACSASANALNQVIEARRDARMARTARRPMPSGRCAPHEALAFAAGSAAAGTGALALTSGPLVAPLLGVSNVAAYAGAYTYLKPRAEINTWVGAVVGAVPPLIGWAAAGEPLWVADGVLSAPAEPWILALALYLWQFPHFFALAWRHRADYARGGFSMVPCDDPTGDRTSRLIFRYSVYSFAVPVLAVATGATGYMFAVEGVALNAALLAAAHRFRRDRSQANATRVFRVTLLYLPLLLLGFVLHSGRLKEDHDAGDAATLGDALDPLRNLGRSLCVHEYLAESRLQRRPTTPSLCPLDTAAQTTKMMVVRGLEVSPVPSNRVQRLINEASTCEGVLAATEALPLVGEETYSWEHEEIHIKRRRLATASALQKLAKRLVGSGAREERLRLVRDPRFGRLIRLAGDALPPGVAATRDAQIDALRSVGALSQDRVISTWRHDIDRAIASATSAPLSPGQVTAARWAAERLALFAACASLERCRELEAALDLPFSVHPSLLADDLPSVDAFRETLPLRADDVVTRSGAVVSERRHTAWLVDADDIGAMAYSGKLMRPQPFPLTVTTARDALQDRLAGARYDCALVNLYPTGDAACKYHADPGHGIPDEPRAFWAQDSAIVSVGEVRRFGFRGLLRDDDDRHLFHLFDGDVVHMVSDCQDTYQHCVFKAEDDQTNVAPRISLVFKRALYRVAPPTTTNLRVAWSVLEWLEEVGQDEDDSVAVAAACIGEHFGMSLADSDQRERFGGTRNLRDVFEAGAAALGSHSTEERYERAVRAVGGDAGFDEFLRAVDDKGYFEGCEPDSLQWRARFVKVADKFLERRRGEPSLRPEHLEDPAPPPGSDSEDVKREVVSAAAVIARALDDDDDDKSEVSEAARKLLLQNPRILQKLLSKSLHPEGLDHPVG
ncbi:hypothetical protein CTAYLR_007786 [Chrysophaeum taylorii]|uniref:Heme O synthase n=1 Tax=Chrysophaeum taylorii TaxID=2483200 RepID=A0AAD7UJ57_9STRA|nr:hypothetical protein CTAYLR_007786 [Chrysophaeum taylorii]